MNILVWSSQGPFHRGGAEMLAESLVAELQARGHRADLVALPFKWYPRAEIVKSALAWRLLDLHQCNGVRVDRVIVTKFPSFVAQHSHKVVWLVHQFRQVYDWYRTPLSDFDESEQARRVRAQVIELDRRTLGEAQARYAISKNVAARLARFNGLDAVPLYPPPRLTGRFRSGEYGDYVLYLGRLDKAKRVDLLIRALSKLPHGRVVIAGTGADADNLRLLAQTLGVSDRVTLTGYIDDERAIDLYANARAVVYAPVDEDYGFATVEAFMSERPVITTTDAGGVLEFVAHQANGLVVEPDAGSVAGALDRAFNSPGLCREWGRAGSLCVRSINWDTVVEKLTG